MTKDFLLYKWVYRTTNKISNYLTFLGKTLVIFMYGSLTFGIDTNVSNSYELFTIIASFLAVSIASFIFVRVKFKVSRDINEFNFINKPINYTVKIINLRKKNISNVSILDTIKLINISKASIKEATGKRFISYKLWKKYVVSNKITDNSKLIDVLEIQYKKEVVFTIMPKKRGLIVFDGLYIKKNDPLNIFIQNFVQKNNDKCYVLPETHPVKQNNKSIKNKETHHFESLKPYRKGDPIKRIHWKSFSKNRILSVVEFDQDNNTAVSNLIVINTYSKNNELFELALSVASSLLINTDNQLLILDNANITIIKGSSIESKRYLSTVKKSSYNSHSIIINYLKGANTKATYITTETSNTKNKYNSVDFILISNSKDDSSDNITYINNLNIKQKLLTL